MGVRTRLAGVALLGIAVASPGCASAPSAADGPAPRLAAEVVQLRRDEVLHRVQVRVTNRGRLPVTVTSVDLRVAAFRRTAAVPTTAPIPGGQAVDLPTAYGAVRCRPDGRRPPVGRVRVVLRVDSGSAPVRVLRVRPRASRPLLRRLATQECRTRRLTRQVALSFGPTWRRSGAGARLALHGSLLARLVSGPPRDLTQLAGTVIYDLAPEHPPPSGRPLARLTPQQPTATVPVVVSRFRCDGHARGETKQPYAFLVWLGRPGGPQLAVNPPVTPAEQRLFREVCPL